jgi:hypothetical protein
VVELYHVLNNKVLTRSSHEFMQRAEASFRALHERIEYLERNQAGQGPTDEQLERVLRKILAERFGEAGTQGLDHPADSKGGEFFVNRPKSEYSIPKTISIDARSLQVDPDAVPSKAYGQAFQMLEEGLQKFPKVDVTKSALNGGIPTHRNDAEA